MGLFQHNVSNDILLSIEYVKLLLKNNKGSETIVYELARQNFGEVSNHFKKIISKKNVSIFDALKNSKTHPYIKELCLAIIASRISKQKLSNLSKKVIEDKETETKAIAKNIDAASNWFILLPFVPVLMILIDLLNTTFQSLPVESGLTNIVIPEEIKPIILAVGLVVLVTLILSLKIKEK
jgi:hypothetical protein